MKTALCFLELNSHEGKQPSALHLCEAGNLKPQTPNFNIKPFNFFLQLHYKSHWNYFALNKLHIYDFHKILFHAISGIIN